MSGHSASAFGSLSDKKMVHLSDVHIQCPVLFVVVLDLHSSVLCFVLLLNRKGAALGSEGKAGVISRNREKAERGAGVCQQPNQVGFSSTRETVCTSFVILALPFLFQELGRTNWFSRKHDFFFDIRARRRKGECNISSSFSYRYSPSTLPKSVAKGPLYRSFQV